MAVRLQLRRRAGSVRRLNLPTMLMTSIRRSSYKSSRAVPLVPFARWRRSLDYKFGTHAKNEERTDTGKRHLEVTNLAAH